MGRVGHGVTLSHGGGEGTHLPRQSLGAPQGPPSVVAGNAVLAHWGRHEGHHPPHRRACGVRGAVLLLREAKRELMGARVHMRPLLAKPRCPHGRWGVDEFAPPPPSPVLGGGGAGSRRQHCGRPRLLLRAWHLSTHSARCDRLAIRAPCNGNEADQGQVQQRQGATTRWRPSVQLRLRLWLRLRHPCQ